MPNPCGGMHSGRLHGLLVVGARERADLVTGEDGSMPRTQLTRLREKQTDDREVLDALLDEARLAHVGAVVDGHPLVLPTAFVRHGDRLVIHGSTGAGWMRAAAAGADVCVTVTALDGIVVARSAFESSMHYRSAVLFGRFEALDNDDKEQALLLLTDKLIPGRTGEIRPSNRKELDATMLLALPIETWSLKISAGWPEDEPSDVAGPAWAGVVSLHEARSAAQPAPDLVQGIQVPDSVARLVAGPEGDTR